MRGSGRRTRSVSREEARPVVMTALAWAMLMGSALFVRREEERRFVEGKSANGGATSTCDTASANAAQPIVAERLRHSSGGRGGGTRQRDREGATRTREDAEEREAAAPFARGHRKSAKEAYLII